MSLSVEERRINRIRRAVRDMRAAAEGADRGHWYRTHSAIVTDTGGQVMVALTDADLLKRGHGSYPTDPKYDMPNARHILAASPARLLKLLDDLRDLSKEVPALRSIFE